MSKVTTHCLNCKKQIITTTLRIKDGRGKFCSRACSSHYNHIGRPKPKSRENIKLATLARICIGRPPWNKKPFIEFICPICNISFTVPQRRKDTAKYCSLDCSYEAKRRVTGPDHPLWKRQQMACENCGKLCWVKLCKINEFRFCSKQCHGSFISHQLAQQKGPTSIEQSIMNELNRRNIFYEAQYQISHWFIDLVFRKHRLAVEIDGVYWHSSPEQKIKDATKDRWLQSHKWSILRLTGDEVRNSPSECVDRIVSRLNNLS